MEKNVCFIVSKLCSLPYHEVARIVQPEFQPQAGAFQVLDSGCPNAFFKPDDDACIPGRQGIGIWGQHSTGGNSKCLVNVIKKGECVNISKLRIFTILPLYQVIGKGPKLRHQVPYSIPRKGSMLRLRYQWLGLHRT